MLDKEIKFKEIIGHINVLSYDNDNLNPYVNEKHIKAIKKIINNYPEIINWSYDYLKVQSGANTLPIIENNQHLDNLIIYDQEKLRGTKTLLSAAIMKNNYSLVNFFISHDANVNAINKNGETILEKAVYYEGKNKIYESTDIVKLLIKNGANPLIDNSLFIAAKYGMIRSFKVLASHIVCSKSVEKLQNQDIDVGVEFKRAEEYLYEKSFTFKLGVPAHLKPINIKEVYPLAKKINNLCYQNAMILRAMSAININIQGNEFNLPLEVIENILFHADKFDISLTPLNIMKTKDYSKTYSLLAATYLGVATTIGIKANLSVPIFIGLNIAFISFAKYTFDTSPFLIKNTFYKGLYKTQCFVDKISDQFEEKYRCIDG